MTIFARLLLLTGCVLTTAVSAGGSTFRPYLFRTLTGSPTAGDTDGTLANATFSGPSGVALDSSGNIYVADTQNLAVRKISPGGQVTTISNGASEFVAPIDVAVDNNGNVYVSDLQTNVIYKLMPDGTPVAFAGSRHQNGGNDGQGTEARFIFPGGIATDSAGNVYVADTDNCTIRKITPAGAVSTLAGSAGVCGSYDGTGSSASFRGPSDVAVDQSGNVYVADDGNATIRKIAPDGAVTTVAGRADARGANDGTGMDVTFSGPRSIALDSAGNIYVADTGSYNLIRQITPAGVVTTLGGGPHGYANGMGGVALFDKPDGLVVDSSGRIYVADSGNNAIRISTPGPVAQMLNLSTRGVVQTGENALIAGLISIGSATSKPVVIRALGPSLTASGVQGTLADPVLELHDATGAVVGSNDNWKVNDANGQSQEGLIRGIDLAPANDAESVLTLAAYRYDTPGLADYQKYTVVVRGKDSTSGIALFEAYDGLPSEGSIFGNLSTRGFVDSDTGVLIGGVILGYQNGATNILARAIGPSLSTAGVTNALSDPTLELHDGNGGFLAGNDDWQDTDAAAIQATGIPPSDKHESALLKPLTPGNYTFIVRGKNGSTGVGLVEIYNLQQ